MSIPVPPFREVLSFDKVQSTILSTLPNPSSTIVFVVRNAPIPFRAKDENFLTGQFFDLHLYN